MINSVSIGHPQSFNAAGSTKPVENDAKAKNIEPKMLSASTAQVKQLKAVVPKPSTIKKAWDKFKNWFNSSPKAKKILEKIEKCVVKHFVKETIKDAINPKAEQNAPALNEDSSADSSNTILYRA